jgi:formylmethanofuran dehydrogenase subunit A
MSSLRLRGGRVIDPTNGSSAGVRDVGVRDGRIVALAPQEPVDEEVDASGCVVMAGGIDMHTHIGGGKVNLSRLLLPEMQRNGANPYALPDNLLELASCNGCTPGTLATGYRYVEMGYTAAFEPAMMACNARHTHMEMGDTPILDHGAYVMLGNDELSALIQRETLAVSLQRTASFLAGAHAAQETIDGEVVKLGLAPV